MSGDMTNKRVTKPLTLNLEKEFNGMFLPLRLGTKVMRFLVDTGACWTLMSVHQIDKCGLRNAITVVHDGGLINIGVLRANAECKAGIVLRFVVAIMPELDTPLLGMNFLLRYGCMLVLDPELPLLIVRPPKHCKLGLLCGVYKKCKLFGHQVTAMLDTGSTHSFISHKLAKEFKLKRRICRPLLVTLFDGTIKLMCRKVRKAELDIDGVIYCTDLILYPNRNVALLLGMNILHGSKICLQTQEISLSTINPLYTSGEQQPNPSGISLTPPQFSVLSNSSGCVSAIASSNKRRFPRIKWPKWLGGGPREGKDTSSSSSDGGNESGSENRIVKFNLTEKEDETDETIESETKKDDE